MSEISEAAKAKAASLSMNEPSWPLGLVMTARDFGPGGIAIAFARYIQAVSDALSDAHEGLQNAPGIYECRRIADKLAPFILPEPADPLYEALFAVVELGRYDTREQTELLRHELAKRGLEIRPVQS